MARLALAGITGMYLRQYRKAGMLGLIGYLVFAAGYLALFSIEVIAATVLPSLVHTEPGFVNDVVAAANGATTHGDIGGCRPCSICRRRLHPRRPPLRHRPVPHPRPRPLGSRPARRQHRRDRGARSAAGIVQPAARRPRGHRAHRPRRIPVAQPAKTAADTATACPRPRARSPMTTPHGPASVAAGRSGRTDLRVPGRGPPRRPLVRLAGRPHHHPAPRRHSTLTGRSRTRPSSTACSPGYATSAPHCCR